MREVVAVDDQAASSGLLGRARGARVVDVARGIHRRDRHDGVDRDYDDGPDEHDSPDLGRKGRRERRETEPAHDDQEIRHGGRVDAVDVVVACRHAPVWREHVRDDRKETDSGAESPPEAPRELQQDDEHGNRERREPRKLRSNELGRARVPELRAIHPEDRPADSE